MESRQARWLGDFRGVTIRPVSFSSHSRGLGRLQAVERRNSRKPRPQWCSTLKIITIALAFSAFASQALGQDKDKDKEPAKPASAAVELFPKGYLNHQALSAAIQKVAAAKPDRVKLRSIAKSGLGRDVWLVEVGKGDTAKPALLVVANLEGDHVVGSQVALGLIESLATTPDKEAGWLDSYRVYIVPRLNPDGAERSLETPAFSERLNLRPIDRDRDGKTNEDGPDDLNGDGLITTIRHKDPKTATLVADEKDPRILHKADPNKSEKPVYAEEPEGIDNDADGLRNEDAPGGVNLNRNWPHKWTEFDLEAGFSPASEPEVLGLIRFALEHPEIAAVWTFGLNDNLVEEPKKPGSTLDDADLPIFVELSKLFNKSNTAKDDKDKPKGGSPAGKGTPFPGVTTDGAMAEWAYYQFGAVGLASRLWSTPEIPAPPAAEKPKTDEKTKADGKPKESAPAIPEDGEARWLYWNDKVVGGQAFLPFVAFDHPTLGKVEVGGWKPGVRLNPPAADIAAITVKHLAFLKALGERLPKLAIVEPGAKAKGGGLYEVTALVENTGFLPTALAQGAKTRKAAPVLVKLLPVDKVKILSGKRLEKIESLGGSGGRKDFRWLIQVPPGTKSVTVEVSSPKAGRVEATIPLVGN